MTAPQKEPGGLTKVLFTRVGEELHDELTRLLTVENDETYGRLHTPPLTMSDFVRLILWREVEGRKAASRQLPRKFRP